MVWRDYPEPAWASAGGASGSGSWRRWREEQEERRRPAYEKDRTWWHHSNLGNYEGQKINAVQIGLGTFGTVIQNLVGERHEWDPVVHWLLEAVSETDPQRFRGVAVEPVREHVMRLQQQRRASLPKFSLVQVAIGEDEATEVEMFVLTKDRHDQMVASVKPHLQRQLEHELVYLRNMSCVGGPHPTFDICRNKAWRKYGIEVSLEPTHTAVWSYGRLSRTLNFTGCELLIIDAEGHDAKILRSMVKHCAEEEYYERDAWPDLIVFESAGHCDMKEGTSSEAAVVQLLEQHDYFVLHRCNMNTDMVRRKALRRSWKLYNWVNKVVCDSCGRQELPMTSLQKKVLCSSCARRQWEQWASDAAAAR